jgi:hypothetical protein
MEVPQVILNRRAAVNRWKQANYAYYLAQKRALASRPEYRAVCRARYRASRDALKEEGVLPRKLGRPSHGEGQEVLDRQRQKAREASARYRARQKISLALLNHEYSPTQNRGEESDRCSYTSGGPAEGT